MPNHKPLRIAVLLSRHSSAALALLFRTVLERANRLLSQTAYDVSFVSALRGRHISVQGVVLELRPLRGPYDYVVVTPLDGWSEADEPHPAESRLLHAQHGKGAVIASACLGALTLAASGLLDGREATTHWAWAAFVRRKYPRVKWAVHRMISDQGSVMTSGGYLGVVDLALHIIERTHGRKTAHAVGQVVLAGSVRQRQSVFAQRLVEPNVEEGSLKGLAQWIDRNLAGTLSARDLARHCGMSLRSLHRKFLTTHGITPRKFVQLKRVERVQEQLRGTRKSLEQVLETVGVSDVASFRRVFQRELGCSPAEYRRRLRIADAERPARR